ncbi:MAG: ComEC/Rec2 family competence protein [Ruminococcus sp.]|nr:ComEC/Rec2 family competence protein [Ruminococcus sp.]
MKRLLAQIGITFFSALAAAFYLNDKITFAVMLAAAVTTIVFFFIRKIRKTIYLPCMAIAVCVACLLNLSYTALFVTPMVEKYQGTHTVEATLKDEPRSDYGTYCYSLRVTSADGEKASFDMILESDEEIAIEPYDTLRFEGELVREEEPYQVCKGFFLYNRAYTLSYQVEPNEEKPFWYFAVQVREYFRDVLEQLLPPDDAALCRAILIGDKYAISGDIRYQFKLSGASYFIVVSGMHFSFFTLLLLFLLKKTVKKRFIYVPIVMGFTLFYMAVTGFSYSVVRAGVMMLVYLTGQLLRRKVYSLNSLGMAGLVLPVCFSPYCAGDIGLILSFYATFAILTWSKPIYEKISIKPKVGQKEKKRHKALNYLLGLLSATLAANILVFPISVFAFQAFSSVTLLSAILLYFEIEGILLLSLVICLLWLIPPLRYGCLLLSWGLYFLCEAVVRIVDTFSRLPFAYVRLGDGFIYLWALMTAVLMLFVYLTKERERSAFLAIFCSLTILLCGAVTTALLKTDKPLLHVYDADGGMMVTLEENRNVYLLAAQGKYRPQYRVLRQIAENYPRAAVAVTEGNAERLLLSEISEREFAFSAIMLYDKKQTEAAYHNVIYYNSERTLSVSDTTEVILFPAGTVAARYIRTAASSALILPDGCDASEIPEEYRTADVIVMGKKVKYPELLLCDTLVLTSNSPYCEIEAVSLQDQCRRVCFVCENDYVTILESSYAE